MEHALPRARTRGLRAQAHSAPARVRPGQQVGRPRRPPASPDGVAALLLLQRLAGNRAVTDWLSGSTPLPAQRMKEESEGSDAEPDLELLSRRFADDEELTAVMRGKATLGKDSTGPAVKKVQQLLNDLGIVRPPLPVSGSYDAATIEAVRSYQTEATFDRRDGVVDQRTMKSLDSRAIQYGGPGATIGVDAEEPTSGPDGLAVTLPERIRAASTPAGMSECRIPPRVDTPVQVRVSGLTTENQPVAIAVEEDGGVYGRATVDGKASLDVRADSIVQLRGVIQSDVGDGLRLVARHRGEVIARSRPFTVAAIPQFYSFTLDSEARGETLGFIVQDAWASDSGVLDDLDKVTMREEIDVTSATGCFSGRKPNVGTDTSATGEVKDHHTVSRNVLTTPGDAVVQQTHVFTDRRSDAVDQPVRSSGYEILQRCEVNEKGGVLMVSKLPKATVVRGHGSGAGAGAATRELPFDR